MRFRPSLHKLLRAPEFLLLAVFFLQLFFWITVRFQVSSFHTDDGPVLRPTPAWQPGQRYTAPIEAGLAALAVSDPDKVGYVRSRGLPIYILTLPEMAHSGCPPKSLGCTRKANSSINVLDTVPVSTVATASVLSHEITHAEHHDLKAPMPPASLPTRLFLRNEEAQAHIAGLRTSAALHVPYWSGPLAGWPLEYLVWYWPFGTIVYTFTFTVLGIARFWKEAAKAGTRRAALRQRAKDALAFSESEIYIPPRHQAEDQP